MILNPRWAGVFLAVAMGGVAAAPLAHAASAPPIKTKVAVAVVPEHAVPDAGESDEGLEARESMAAPTVAPAAQPAAAQPAAAAPVVLASTNAPPRPDTLDAQYAAMKAAPAAGTIPGPLAAMGDQPLTPAVAVATPAPALARASAAPAGPSVALARRVVESAQAFADYMRRASAVRPDYADAAGVARALRSGATYEPAQLEEGAVAYVAMAALQDAAFVEGVNQLAAAGGRNAVAGALAADPRQVLRTPGATEAAMRAAAALARYGVGLQSAGAAVKQSAYDIQHADWSKTAVAAPQAVLAELKARSAVREALSDDGGRTLIASLSDLRRPTALNGSGRLTPTVAKGLTLAALAVLGEAGEEQAVQVAALLAEDKSAECLKMARLNLYQCLSVAGPQYEDVFCLGQHAMMETSRCVVAASGWTPAAVAPALAAPAVQVAAAPPRPASIMVPVAMTTDAPAGPDAQPDVGPDAGPAVEPGPDDGVPPGAPPPMAGRPAPAQLGGGAGER